MELKQGRLCFDCGGIQQVQVHQYPDSFVAWQIATRTKGLKIFLGEEKGVPNFSAHTVVMNTHSDDAFPVNSCIKGLGLVPREDLLEPLATEILEMIQLSREVGPEKTFADRVRFIQRLYGNERNFDRRFLSSIEMYHMKTYANIESDPRSNLLFYDPMTGYSIMFHVVTELMPRGTDFYRYVTAIHDLFHLPKDPETKVDRYAYAYRYWLVEAYDKTPGPQAGKPVSLTPLT